jgi:hypothetical protein
VENFTPRGDAPEMRFRPAPVQITHKSGQKLQGLNNSVSRITNASSESKLKQPGYLKNTVAYITKYLD